MGKQKSKQKMMECLVLYCEKGEMDKIRKLLKKDYSDVTAISVNSDISDEPPDPYDYENWDIEE